MQEHEATLPSGLSGILRPIKMGDLAPLTDRKLVRKPGPAVEAAILNQCWLSTDMTGPYSFTGKPPWLREVLQGDFADALRQLRSISWGGRPHEFRVPCQHPYCNALLVFESDLSDMAIRALSDEALAVVQAGNRFEDQLSDGTRFVYQLPTGQTSIRTERWFGMYGRSLHVTYAARLVEVEGLSTPSKFPQWVADLDGELGLELRDKLEKHNCGVETGRTETCEECDLTQEVDALLGAEIFTAPRPKKAGSQKQETETAEPA